MPKDKVKKKEPLENEVAELENEETSVKDILDSEQLKGMFGDLNEEQLANLLLEMGKEKATLEERVLRLQADFDNFRKRTRQEKEALVNFANADLVRILLPVVDNLERGIDFGKNANSSKESFVEGMQMIYRQLVSELTTAGLEEIAAVGADFDPNFHEAVLQEDAGASQCGKVIAELQKGYLFNGRLLRPSMVKVGK